MEEAAADKTFRGFYTGNQRRTETAKKIPGKLLFLLNDTNSSEFLAQKGVRCSKCSFEWDA